MKIENNMKYQRQEPQLAMLPLTSEEILSLKKMREKKTRRLPLPSLKITSNQNIRLYGHISTLLTWIVE